MPFFLTKILGRHMLPVRAGYIRGLEYNGKKKTGVFIGSPMDAKDMISNRNLAEKKIIKAAKFAEKLGVDIIGLGALSASFTKNGLAVKNKTHCRITTGHAFTAWIVSENAIRIKNLVKRELTIAIVGAAGSVGASCYAFLSDYFSKFVLIDKNLEKLKNKININNNNIIKYTDSMDAIKLADLVITVTNAPYAIINNINQIKPRTIIIDDAQPLNASKNLNSRKHKSLVIEAGVCNLNGLKYNLNLGLIDDGDMFSCMGELVTLAALESPEVTLGDATKNQILKISDMAHKLGIKSARFRSFGELVDEDYLKYILN
jgi:predicted amino acid dehydrogenase